MKIQTVNPKYIEQAQILHRDNYVADAHLDLAGEILLRHGNGETDIIRRYYLDNFRAAGLNLVMSTIYVDDAVLPEAGLKNALLQISALLKDLEGVENDVILVKTAEELDIAYKLNKIAIILYIEGLDFIGLDLSLLDVFYELGVRGASLTWSRRNLLAGGCCRARDNYPISGGLSEHGFAALEKLTALSCFIDVSHLNDDGFTDIMKAADKPIIATHSNARTIHPSYRNLTDEQIRSLCRRGGIIGINALSLIAGSYEDENHLDMLCRHAMHIANLVGSKHLCYGFDLCDSYARAELKECSAYSYQLNEKLDCFRDHSEMPLLTAALLECGLPENEVIGIIGRNIREFLREFLR